VKPGRLALCCATDIGQVGLASSILRSTSLSPPRRRMPESHTPPLRILVVKDERIIAVESIWHVILLGSIVVEKAGSWSAAIGRVVWLDESLGRC